MPKKVFEGKVVSNKMQNTVVVAVEMPKRHPLYGKEVKNTKKLKARTDKKLNEGDIVTIEESRPFSKTVTWKVISVKE